MSTKTELADALWDAAVASFPRADSEGRMNEELSRFVNDTQRVHDVLWSLMLLDLVRLSCGRESNDVAKIGRELALLVVSLRKAPK